MTQPSRRLFAEHRAARELGMPVEALRERRYKPGQYTAFAEYEAVRQGGVLFAGEHTSMDFQGFMEAAPRRACGRPGSWRG